MNVIQWIVILYLSIGFAKFVLDMSRLPFIYAVIESVEMAVLDSDDDYTFRTKLFLLFTCALTIQAWLGWPEILFKEGLLSFIQPISRERAAEIVGLPFGLRLEPNDD